jgi:hypothetical protein
MQEAESADSETVVQYETSILESESDRKMQGNGDTVHPLLRWKHVTVRSLEEEELHGTVKQSDRTLETQSLPVPRER